MNDGDSDGDYDEAYDDDYEAIEKLDSQTEEGKASRTLTKDELLICSSSLKGYSLNNKKWRELAYPLQNF